MRSRAPGEIAWRAMGPDVEQLLRWVLHDRPAVARGRDGTRGRATTAMSRTCSGGAGDAPGAFATAAHDHRGRGVPRLPHDRRGSGTGQEAAAPALRTRRPRSAPVRAVRVGPLQA